ncbi:MAG: DUF6915 family protein [Terriglobales bacterium]
MGKYRPAFGSDPQKTLAVPHPRIHAQRSAKKFGGEPEDYLAINAWFDESKAFFGDFRHRAAVRHHTEGIFLAERIFGVAITNSGGSRVPVRYIGEQHDKEDLAAFPRRRTGSPKFSPSAGCIDNAAPWTPIRPLIEGHP